MFSVERHNSRFKNPGFKDFDPTCVNIKQKILPLIFDTVVESAKILQEENDTPFERGDLIYNPSSKMIWEVLKVYDNSHRIAIRKIQLECRHDKTTQIFDSASVLHLGYLIQAHRPYDEKLVCVTGDTQEDILTALGEALEYLKIK